MWQPFQAFSIASSSAIQPLVFTTTTQQILPTMAVDICDPVSGSPIGQVQAIGVSATWPFALGDKVYLDIGASAEKLVIQPGSGGIIVSNSSLSLRPTKNHASGAFVTLCYQCDSVTVSAPSGNSGTIYLFAWPRAFTTLDSYGRGSLQPTVSGGAPGSGNPLLLAPIAAGGQWSSSDIFGAPGPLASEFLFVCGPQGATYSVVLISP